MFLVTSFAGKVMLGWTADRYGRLNVLWACTTMSAISVFCLWAPASIGAVSNELTKRALFVTYVILYGITSGTYVSLFPPVLFDLVGPVSRPDHCYRPTLLKSPYWTFTHYQQYFSSVNGALYFLRGIGTLVGTPSAGALIKGGRRSGAASPEGFLHAIIMTGLLLAASAVCVGWVRVEKSRRDGWKWKT
jgi:MFS family permease